MKTNGESQLPGYKKNMYVYVYTYTNTYKRQRRKIVQSAFMREGKFVYGADKAKSYTD